MSLRILSVFLLLVCASSANDDFPVVADDLVVSLFAQDPLVRNPCAITFDAKGRLCVGMGPQYRSPNPLTKGDSVFILIDRNGDGLADERKEFATGFNAIQGLAWKGRDLWVANAPDLTIVRDLNDDDEADEYLRVYTDLGNLEHGLHGLNWGPDGKLYMSKGNSKGLSQPPHRVAPKPFRDLWGVQLSTDVPDFPMPVVSGKNDYRKNYHDPSDDWGLSGGILRCDADGSNLEIVSRGMRNPWDITFDDEFNWLGTDNDQTLGDKIIAPFYGSHFGWGHMWSYDWKGYNHLPTVPAAGPLFEGSGTGIIFSNVDGWPEKYRDVFLINDWLRREVYIYRAKWDGAAMQSSKEAFDLFAHAEQGRTMQRSGGRRFDPVDIEIGPDGAVYISSWGREYGAVVENGRMVNEGRIYRIRPNSFTPRADVDSKRNSPIGEWNIEQLIEDLKSDLPVWRVNAQEELVRRGDTVRDSLLKALRVEPGNPRLQTWGLWTLGRMSGPFRVVDEGSVNRQIQTLRIQAFQARRDGSGTVPVELLRGLESRRARIRHEAVLALQQLNVADPVGELMELAAGETDRMVYYSTWQTLRSLLSAEELKAALTDQRAGVRRAVLLALLEDDVLSNEEIRSMTNDADPATRGLARRRLGGKDETIVKGPALVRRTGSSRNAENQIDGVARKPLSVVHSIKTVSRRPYEEAVLEHGTRAFTDRGYLITDIPELLEGETFVRSANDDADQALGTGITLDLRYPSTVFLADDSRGEKLPEWARGNFQATDMTLSMETPYSIYQANYPAGLAEFGPNRQGVAGRKGNYILIIQPNLLNPPDQPTTIADVLPLVEGADIEHGRNLFLHGRGATCALCHQLEGRGNIFAPDLSDIGSRADPEFVVRSILQPSAAITEGFASQRVVTSAGDEYTGIVLGETGRVLSLATAAGEVHEIAKATIKSRKGLEVSAMPDIFHTILNPSDVASITRYLLSVEATSAAANRVDDPVVELPPAALALSTTDRTKTDALTGQTFGSTNGFGLEVSRDRLNVRLNGSSIGSYYFRHDKIWRPFFAHLKTPDGIQVTRNFPPIETDPDDHWDMHPGLSMGFAVLDGVNFWHNREGAVVHQRFAHVNAEVDRADFTVVNHYVDADRNLLCREIARYQFREPGSGVLLTIDTRMQAEKTIYFGVKEEMGLAVRVATPITVKFGDGSILNSAGGLDEKGTWGRVDRWWDYRGLIDGQFVGLQIMSAPDNPAVWSHSRDYGVLVANPFPVDTERNRDKKFIVARGDELRLRFGIQIHQSSREQDYDPETSYQNYVKGLKNE